MTWLTTLEAATYLRKSVHEVRRNAFDQTGGKTCPEGAIPGYKTGGRWRFDVTELDAYVRGDKSERRPILTRRSRAS